MRQLMTLWTSYHLDELGEEDTEVVVPQQTGEDETEQAEHFVHMANELLKNYAKSDLANSVGEALSNNIKNLWRTPMDYTLFKENLEQMKFRENCGFLAARGVNQKVFEDLNDAARGQDTDLQHKQNMLAKAAGPIAHVLNALSTLNPGDTIDSS